MTPGQEAAVGGDSVTAEDVTAAIHFGNGSAFPVFVGSASGAEVGQVRNLRGGPAGELVGDVHVWAEHAAKVPYVPAAELSVGGVRVVAAGKRRRVTLNRLVINPVAEVAASRETPFGRTVTFVGRKKAMPRTVKIVRGTQASSRSPARAMRDGKPVDASKIPVPVAAAAPKMSPTDELGYDPAHFPELGYIASTTSSVAASSSAPQVSALDAHKTAISELNQQRVAAGASPLPGDVSYRDQPGFVERG